MTQTTAKTDKVIITCAVTGAIHTPSMSQYLPVTATEIAHEAIAAAEAGAALCGFFNRFNDVLQIDMESGVLQDLLSSGASESLLPAAHD